MNPNYFDFIRFQDKRILAIVYIILFVVLGFYWKNNNYNITQHDVVWVSGLLAIMLFNFIYELKAYWTYSCLLERVDFLGFEQKKSKLSHPLISRPIVVSVAAFFAFILILQCSLFIPILWVRVLVLYLITPLCIYLILRGLRTIYIRQLFQAVEPTLTYKNLYHYVAYSVATVCVLNIISISPLTQNAAFSLQQGFFSIPLMVAMLILCSIVLFINLVFARITKRYIFLGRIFLKEFKFVPEEQLPFAQFQSKPFVFQLIMVFIALIVWIVILSALLQMLQSTIAFEFYFLLCFLPCLIYLFLHSYWRAHYEFVLAFDMLFRYNEIQSRKQVA